MATCRQQAKPRRWLVSAMRAAVGVSAIAGCNSHPATTVRGIVTLDGEPVEKAIVQFVPERRDVKTAVALTDRNGRYVIPISPAPFRVAIVAQRVVGQKQDDANPNGSLIDLYEDVIPVHYSKPETSPLRVEPVVGKATESDFRMTKAAPQP